MNFLKTAFWVVLAVALALFAKANWIYVPVKLWGDTILETRLPILIIIAFLLGLLPTWIWGSVTKWHMRRKLHSAQRALENNIVSQQTAPLPAVSGGTVSGAERPALLSTTPSADSDPS